MVSDELQLHALAAYNLKSPISELYHRVSCSQFEIRQIANETLVLYVPVLEERIRIYFIISLLLVKKNQFFHVISISKNCDVTSNVFKHNALAGARGSSAATKSHTLILPS